MNKSRKILLVIMILAFSIYTGYSQNISQQTDTLQVKSKKSESNGDAKGHGDKEDNTKQTGSSGMSGGSQTIRQVRGGRPDMGKARGARPPIIVRPTGSGIPRGVGKPGGAGRYGGR